MAFYDKFPYTNFHELNLDWIIKKIGDIDRAKQASAESATASAQSATASAQSANESAQSATASAQSANESAQSAEESAQSATEANNYVASTRDQLDLLQSRVNNIIPSGTQTEGNTELLDIRVGYNGLTYPSAGDAVRGQILENISNENERFNLNKTPLYTGFESAEIISSLERKYINGSGAVSDDDTNALSNTFDINRETDAVRMDCDFNIYKIAICCYQNETWIKNTSWQTSAPPNNLYKLNRISGDFNKIKIQYNRKVTAKLTSEDDNNIIKSVSVRKGVNTLLSDINILKTDSIKYYSAIAPLSEEKNHLLSNVNENCVFNGSPEYWTDTPRGYGGSFLCIKYTSNYVEQFFIESSSANRYERVVNIDGTIYRNWSLDTRSRFINKKVYCTGDSIMWGRTDSDGRATLTIPNNIASRLPVIVTNSAVGGDTITSRSDEHSVYNRITNVDLSTYDYVIINGGTNDYGYGETLGTIDSTDVNTFYGAYKAIIEYIYKQNAYMNIMLITPTFRNYVAQGGSWHYGNGYNTKGDGDYTLNDICNAIIEIGNKYNIPVYDSRKNSPCNELNYMQTMELTSDSTDRYLHLTDQSYKKYGDSIASFFESNF